MIMVLSWNLQNMLETAFPSFISKKLGEIPIFGTFSGRPCLKTSLRRHTLADFQKFGINGKGRPSPILCYHTLILWTCQSQVHRGGNHPSRKMCYGKYLRKTRVKGRRIGRSDKVSLCYVALLINTRFRFFILEQAILSACNVTLRQRTSKWLREAIKS